MSAILAEKVTQYAALAEMGIFRVNEISNYSLRQDGPDKDVLRVIYKRAKGSLLPFSRKYKFGRSVKTVVVDGGTSRMERTYEISPFLLKAVAELEDLLVFNQYGPTEPSTSNKDLKASLMAEINVLKQLINQSIRAESMGAVNAKLDSVRRHIDAL
ncbi:hypothetical protein IMCC3135_17510 [Granulosicoccus antarcticus IMCC3135]|uniref:Uncharacterized protein n=2 Tax=Granulosicoccus TaxID=437504 RepID=A0A2Z2NQH8_9GAMM|nr:hypothetical protein IMCC3135_17510 [Granulosicoccus antarcticus IMCC3135]